MICASDEITIYCIPFAGGSKSSFQTFVKNSVNGIRFAALEAPGRGGRVHEPLIYDLDKLLNDYMAQLTSLQAMHGGPFAIWGHSMGATVATWLAYRLLQGGHQQPSMLFHTSKIRPSHRLDHFLYQLPEPLFMKSLIEEGAIPQILQRDLKRLTSFLPVIKADIQTIETSIWHAPTKLPVPIHIFNSEQEQPTKGDLEIWQQESASSVTYQSLPGDHFFIYNFRLEVINEFTRLSNHLLSAEIEYQVI